MKSAKVLPLKGLYVAVCLGALVMQNTIAVAKGEPIIVSPSAMVKNQIKVYYFHGDYRCDFCLRMEENICKVLGENYQKEIDKKQIELIIVNLSISPDSNTYKDKYKLEHNDLVLVLVKDSEEKDYKKPWEIWNFVYDYPAFKSCFIKEINLYLEKLFYVEAKSKINKEVYS
ncbi:MAG: hypothetical protein A2Y40_02380 [Candidatus Margulisbacteria bacterium GWF2_35_9]|nr:MAG: hypothetical protein A2Y40_02380 [Candidatus Margulisbacteria bacterium GWF2_35_9]